MLELYFILYRIPKTMTRLARARNRSAIAWSLIGIGAWLATEIVVGFTGGSLYGIGVFLWGWPRRSPGFSLLLYIVALVAAVGSISVVSRILSRKDTEGSFPVPPPPPQF